MGQTQDHELPDARNLYTLQQLNLLHIFLITLPIYHQKNGYIFLLVY